MTESQDDLDTSKLVADVAALDEFNRGVVEEFRANAGKVLIVGTNAGAPSDPAWVHNLRANPKAHIEIGTDAYDITVRELSADERDAAYPKIIEKVPVFADYQAKTSRAIPLFELVRD
jgi:deazaflavin-dependent oxidoreductase (nitroreductase family)